jgi:hypothetical protein
LIEVAVQVESAYDKVETLRILTNRFAIGVACRGVFLQIRDSRPRRGRILIVMRRKISTLELRGAFGAKVIGRNVEHQLARLAWHLGSCSSPSFLRFNLGLVKAFESE